MTKFSELVKSKRKTLNLSQSKFANILGVSILTIWRWENGLNEPKPDAMEYWINKIKKAKP